MLLSDYQRLSRRTATYPGAGENIVYPTLGLSGEAGEVAEKVKKMLRDDGGVMTGERLQALAGELGDVLWDVAQVATEAGLDLEEVAQANLDKLLSRQERGVLSGSGDSRCTAPASRWVCGELSYLADAAASARADSTAAMAGGSGGA